MVKNKSVKNKDVNEIKKIINNETTPNKIDEDRNTSGKEACKIIKQTMLITREEKNIIIKYEKEVEILQAGELEIGSEVTLPQEEEEQSVVPLPEKGKRRKRKAKRKIKDKESV